MAQTITSPTISGVLSLGGASTVASASPLALDGTTSYYVVTGTTGFSAITHSGGEGTILVLRAGGAFTLTASATVLLSAATWAPATVGDSLQLIKTDVADTWAEIGRSD